MIFTVIMDFEDSTLSLTCAVYQNGILVARGIGKDTLSATTSAFAYLQRRNPRVKVMTEPCRPWEPGT